MAQLIIDNLDDDVQNKLRDLARGHGRTVEEEAGAILRGALQPPVDDAGLGTRIARRFEGIGLQQDIPELRGSPAEPPKLES